MANRELDKILEQEYEIITRHGRSEGAARFLDMIPLLADAPTRDEWNQTRSSSSMPVVAEFSSASSINRGYTFPDASGTENIRESQSSIAATAGTAALKLFTSGLGVMPLISGLAALFGGGEPAPPPALVKYAMPPSIQITAANSKDGGTLSYADYDQRGTVRSFGTTSNPGLAQVAPVSRVPGNSSAGQIVVNVQAIDSRSFLDHSQEIAQAVREAMLNMHSLNDVVSEL